MLTNAVVIFTLFCILQNPCRKIRITTIESPALSFFPVRNMACLWAEALLTLVFKRLTKIRRRMII